MHMVVEAHRLLKQLAPPSTGWARRLAAARTLARGLMHRVPPALRPNHEDHLEDHLEGSWSSDHLTADFYLVPYQAAYSVRELGALLATSGLCMLRPEPAWRYDLTLVDMELPDGAAARLSALDQAALADEYWAAAINHRFHARRAVNAEEEGGVCQQDPSDPLDPKMAPVFVWDATIDLLPKALETANATARFERLLTLVSPGPFGRVEQDSLDNAQAHLPAHIQMHIGNAVDAFPADAAAFAARANGCESVAATLRRSPDERDLRMLRTLDLFFHLRAAADYTQALGSAL